LRRPNDRRIGSALDVPMIDPTEKVSRVEVYKRMPPTSAITVGMIDWIR